MLTSLRRRGSYAVPGSASPQALQEAMVAMELRLSAAVASAATAAAAAAVAQMQQQHSALEISRSSGAMQSARLQLSGTPVDDSQRPLFAIEGGPLHIS